MARPKKPKEERKAKITITPAPEVLEWIDANKGLGKRFKDRTHAFEYAVSRLMQNEDGFYHVKTGMADTMIPKKENDEDKANKIQISIYVDPEMLKIVDAQVKRQRWGSRSHAFGYAMYEALLELGFIKENGVSEPKDQSGPSE